MDPITRAMRLFFDDAEAFWHAHPGRLLVIIAAEGQRALVAQALWPRELAPDGRRPIVVFDEPLTATGTYSHGFADAITEQHALIRAALAEDGAELPPFAGEHGTRPSGAVECAVLAIKRARLLADPRGGFVVAGGEPQS